MDGLDPRRRAATESASSSADFSAAILSSTGFSGATPAGSSMGCRDWECRVVKKSGVRGSGVKAGWRIGARKKHGGDTFFYCEPPRVFTDGRGTVWQLAAKSSTFRMKITISDVAAAAK